jgi:ABC-type uncharacterized transport system involved in gliding motility auxiliary subunit
MLQPSSLSLSRTTSGPARVVDARRAVATRVDVKRILKLLMSYGKQLPKSVSKEIKNSRRDVNIVVMIFV